MDGENIRQIGARVAGEFCKKCRFFDPVIRKNELFSGVQHISTETELFCNHVEICENLVTLLKEEKHGTDC